MHEICSINPFSNSICLQLMYFNQSWYLKAIINFYSQSWQTIASALASSRGVCPRRTSFRGQAKLASVVPIQFHSDPVYLGNRILQPHKVDEQLSLSHQSGPSSLCPHVQPLLNPQSEPSRTGHKLSPYQSLRLYSSRWTVPCWAICRPWEKCR
jgi:hypothetical protein